MHSINEIDECYSTRKYSQAPLSQRVENMVCSIAANMRSASSGESRKSLNDEERASGRGDSESREGGGIRCSAGVSLSKGLEKRIFGPQTFANSVIAIG